MKHLLLVATVLTALSGPVLAKEFVPCVNMVNEAAPNVVVTLLTKIWQQQATPEHPAVTILDVIPPILGHARSIVTAYLPLRSIRPSCARRKLYDPLDDE